MGSGMMAQSRATFPSTALTEFPGKVRSSPTRHICTTGAVAVKPAAPTAAERPASNEVAPSSDWQIRSPRVISTPTKQEVRSIARGVSIASGEAPRLNAATRVRARGGGTADTRSTAPDAGASPSASTPGDGRFDAERATTREPTSSGACGTRRRVSACRLASSRPARQRALHARRKCFSSGGRQAWRHARGIAGCALPPWPPRTPPRPSTL
mmetsp:Transcript_26839/g.86236  ORF Transcript_26839/g.86236 Transcript_26839/m.86236 type:complete len:212 (+) Transcript_26839:467-1102(+)